MSRLSFIQKLLKQIKRADGKLSWCVAPGKLFVQVLAEEYQFWC